MKKQLVYKIYFGEYSNAAGYQEVLLSLIKCSTDGSSIHQTFIKRTLPCPKSDLLRKFIAYLIFAGYKVDTENQFTDLKDKTTNPLSIERLYKYEAAHTFLNPNNDNTELNRMILIPGQTNQKSHIVILTKQNGAIEQFKRIPELLNNKLNGEDSLILRNLLVNDNDLSYTFSIVSSDNIETDLETISFDNVNTIVYENGLYQNKQQNIKLLGKELLSLQNGELLVNCGKKLSKKIKYPNMFISIRKVGDYFVSVLNILNVNYVIPGMEGTYDDIEDSEPFSGLNTYCHSSLTNDQKLLECITQLCKNQGFNHFPLDAVKSRLKEFFQENLNKGNINDKRKNLIPYSFTAVSGAPEKSE